MERQIEILLKYAERQGLISGLDRIVCRNNLIELLGLTKPVDGDTEAIPRIDDIDAILEPILDYAVRTGLIEEDSIVYRDLFEDRIMALLTPRQSEIERKFSDLTEKYGADRATAYFYGLSRATNYIKVKRINKNLYWTTHTEYGDIEITINLSKPEKDPKEIARAKTVVQSGYPKCLLCAENIGFSGNINHPPRRTHRIIPVELNSEEWYLQYSPYLYYNEHCIVLSGRHMPMKISKETFVRLLDFVEMYPHYFVGSNADLPIVGGSILTHDHFQGGGHDFPMASAPVERSFKSSAYLNTKLNIVKWPMSVIRLNGCDKAEIVKLAVKVLESWRMYSDETVGIHAFSGDTPHNTITPIARMNAEGAFELDLVLRNNRTSEAHPDGIFHPHKELHHVKKENIGLIEVMGLAVLPGRLAAEISDANDKQAKQEEIGRVFEKVLEHAGVYKRDEVGQKAFDAFVTSLGFYN